jgi:hypothetical protein
LTGTGIRVYDITMKKILLENTGNYTLVDNEDYDKVISFGKWHENDSGYAVKRGKLCGKSRTIRLHRVVADPPKRVEVDHINGDRLDNRKSNLRVVSRAINAWNTAHNNRRIYDKGLPTGIAWDNTRGKYIATRITRKRFDTLKDAIAYQKESELYEHEHRRMKKGLPTGVFQNKTMRKYQARIRINGERIYLGCFTTIEEAEKAYLERKRG